MIYYYKRRKMQEEYETFVNAYYNGGEGQENSNIINFIDVIQNMKKRNVRGERLGIALEEEWQKTFNKNIDKTLLELITNLNDAFINQKYQIELNNETIDLEQAFTLLEQKIGDIVEALRLIETKA